MLWRVFPPAPVTSKPDGFILPYQPGRADRPPSGPARKFDGSRVIARKDGAQVRGPETRKERFEFERKRDACGWPAGRFPTRLFAGIWAACMLSVSPSSWPVTFQ